MPQHQALFKLCAQRSKDRLTHVDVLSLATRPGHLKQYLKLIRPSARTLVDLRITEDTMCECQPCQDGPRYLQSLPYTSHFQPMHREVFQLISETRNLEHLTIELTLEHPIEVDLASLPRPKSLSIIFTGNRHWKSSADAFAWLLPMLREAERLTMWQKQLIGIKREGKQGTPARRRSMKPKYFRFPLSDFDRLISR